MEKHMSSTTRKQLELLLAILDYIDSNGYSPAIRDLQGLVTFNSTCTIHKYICMLEDAGYIQRKELSSRALMITDEGRLIIKKIRFNF